jgi:hypothetical protein
MASLILVVLGVFLVLILQLHHSAKWNVNNQMMPATPAMQYQPVIPDLKADFNLTVNPSPEFGMMVEAVADKRIEWALMIRISRLVKVF